MKNFLTYLAVVLVVAAIVKPTAPVPGLVGWLRDFAMFMRTCVRVGLVIFLLLLLMIVLGSFDF